MNPVSCGQIRPIKAQDSEWHPAITPSFWSLRKEREMPLQNRVTPFGDIIAVDARSMFTGNRGILHLPKGRRLASRRWTTKAWLICRCDFQGRRRDVMTGRKWTELFFLDEATALAAGHRPCFLCRRGAALRFRDGWNSAPSVKVMDAALHSERLNGRDKRLHPLPSGPLPVGVIAASGHTSWLWAGRWLEWSPRGYSASEPPDLDGMLTPPSSYAVMKAGYRPVLHPSAYVKEAGHDQ
ncbi:hypothetical protein SAMN05421538_1153 [Paracoccus isoporae]|uniref:Uncharacterized protein n=2 Tax=Paracoccus isoporae TaxID=591205 RepID=A0A1G7GTV4_9RHOB|nr:hypothetical protein SAMN05421538_1153 [Paracoccus isoporae]